MVELEVGFTQTSKVIKGTAELNGTFVSASDRNLKENFKPIDPQKMLDGIKGKVMKGASWRRIEVASTLSMRAHCLLLSKGKARSGG